MNFNKYINEIDFSEVRKLFLNKGESIDIKKKDYFVRQNEPCKYVGLIQNGIFRYTCIDNEGNEHIVGYSFAKDFVCDYPSLIKNSNSLTNTQSVTDSTVYILSIKELNDYWETNMDTQRFGKLVAEELLIEMYQRLLGFYCETAEQRYIALLQRCPDLPLYITLKEIASFLGVTPETVSHIRRKLRQK
ncbi:Crp/Fnr family transcriptional regulator [Parabacteroides faecis]|uniref:Crp/Fnr family transcriptional regulator n=1 Tax=Parabacteroides TaxID=375288 RepID=UPI000EFDF63E|nr:MULTISPECIES: Crp/Fnr family transcriptional regulator [Parabacteroides]MBC8616913.1 Crp/Fnr family transcriptional regulator [Parabacteroides faecis]RHR94401.1 Crp/Fnr family transcriptional regulator [Parabacteroides sp. AF14-59]